MNEPTTEELNQIRNPVRKRNRLENYDYSTAGMYFITICTRNKEKLFGYITDGDEWNPPQMNYSEIGIIIYRQILTINRVKNIKVEKYTVMPNHVHMILLVEMNEIPEKSPSNALIPNTIGGFKRLCAKNIGEDVFQRSYYDNIIRSQRMFEKIWNYIEDNPRRWKEDRFYEP